MHIIRYRIKELSILLEVLTFVSLKLTGWILDTERRNSSRLYKGLHFQAPINHSMRITPGIDRHHNMDTNLGMIFWQTQEGCLKGRYVAR